MGQNHIDEVMAYMPWKLEALTLTCKRDGLLDADVEKILRGEHLHEKNDKTAGGYVPVTAIVDESCRLQEGVGQGAENN